MSFLKKAVGVRRGAILAGLSVCAALSVNAVEYNLSPAGSQSLDVPGDVGGTAIFSDQYLQPTGTGVFKPFLSLDANGKTSTGNKYSEQAYNTEGFDALYLDAHRPQWNNLLRFGDLAQFSIERNNVTADYVAFVLDSNEPGSDKSLISVDNVRIYTSSIDNTANVGNDISKLNDLGTLRWALNDPLKNGNKFDIDNWIKLDSAQENLNVPSNGGSGMADMVVYVPVTAFSGVLPTDFVWFYNLNGVHYTCDRDLSSESGFEEWSAITKPERQNVPEGGATLALLGAAMIGVGALRRKLR